MIYRNQFFAKWFFVVMLLAALSRYDVAAPQLAVPYVWTDEKAVITWPDVPPQAEYSSAP